MLASPCVALLITIAYKETGVRSDVVVDLMMNNVNKVLMYTYGAEYSRYVV